MRQLDGALTGRRSDAAVGELSGPWSPWPDFHGHAVRWQPGDAATAFVPCRALIEHWPRRELRELDRAEDACPPLWACPRCRVLVGPSVPGVTPSARYPESR